MAGHLLDANGISRALQEAEPAYLALIAANEKERDLFAQTVLDLFIQHLTGRENQGTELYRIKRERQ